MSGRPTVVRIDRVTVAGTTDPSSARSQLARQLGGRLAAAGVARHEAAAATAAASVARHVSASRGAPR